MEGILVFFQKVTIILPLDLIILLSDLCSFSLPVLSSADKTVG